METVGAAVVSALISAVIGAVVASIVAAMKSKGHEVNDRAQAMQDGIKLLLMDKTRYLTQRAVDEGEITIQQKTFIHSMVDTAHALGANGEMTACADEIDKLDIKHG